MERFSTFRLPSGLRLRKVTVLPGPLSVLGFRLDDAFLWHHASVSHMLPQVRLNSHGILSYRS